MVTEEKRLKGDESSIEKIELKSDESCTEMAAKKTDKHTLNNIKVQPLGQPLEHESDESTIEEMTKTDNY